MADESTDVSVTEQMSICVRYIAKQEVREDLFGICWVAYLKQMLKQLLKAWLTV